MSEIDEVESAFASSGELRALHVNVENFILFTNTWPVDLAEYLGIDGADFTQNEQRLYDTTLGLSEWARVAKFFDVTLTRLLEREMTSDEFVAMGVFDPVCTSRPPWRVAGYLRKLRSEWGALLPTVKELAGGSDT